MTAAGTDREPALGRQRLDHLQQQGQAGPPVRAVLQRHARLRVRRQVGVSPVLFYDPAERVVATLHPNHTYEKVVFDPWQQTTYDVNDTCAPRNAQTGDPRTDPDIGGYVAEYFTDLPSRRRLADLVCAAHRRRAGSGRAAAAAMRAQPMPTRPPPSISMRSAARS